MQHWFSARIFSWLGKIACLLALAGAHAGPIDTPVPEPPPATEGERISTLDRMSMTQAAPDLRAARRPANIETLTLRDAIRRAESRNYGFEMKRITLRLAEITYSNAWNVMYLPKSSIRLSSTHKVTVGNNPNGAGRNLGHQEAHYGFPSESGVQLTLGEYTIYNFGKDLMTYEGARLTWERARETFEEATRDLRFSVARAFFSAKTTLDRLDAAQRSADIAKAIYDLIDSQVRLGKATKDDLASAQLDLTSALRERDTQETNSKSSVWSLNQLLGDAIGTNYKIIDSARARYRPVTLKVDDLLKIYTEYSPSMRTQKLAVKTAEMALKTEEKARLPLPEVKFDGVKVNYGRTIYGTRTTYGTSNTLDVGATVSLTLPLYGENGLFNARKIETAELNLDTAELTLRQTRDADVAAILGSLQQLKQQEETVENTQKALESSAALLDNLFKQVSSSFSSKRLELRDAIKQARQAEIDYSDAVASHFNAKLDLATKIGVDRLPGDIDLTGAGAEPSRTGAGR